MLMLAALLFELLLGWPNWLFARIRHPVVWMGALITLLERLFNQEAFSRSRRFVGGVATTLLLVGVSAGCAATVSYCLPDHLPGFLVEALLASSLLAGRGLYQHVAAVVAPLRQGNLPAARQAVSMIVGRDTAELDEAGISAAALESLAENTSDGVIAPLFWGVLFGLPGLAAYKAVNTLDSMIGHRNPRYEDFGCVAARLDDVVNWVPARLSAVLFWVADACRCSFVRIVRQAGHHRSPNAGWPESAMAFALGVRLSGPRSYHSGVSNEPWLNPEGQLPGVDELEQGLSLYALLLLQAALLLLISGLIA